MTPEDRVAALAQFAEQIAASARAFCDDIDRIIAEEKASHDALMGDLKSSRS